MGYLRQYAMLNDPPSARSSAAAVKNQSLTMVTGLLNNVWIVKGSVAPHVKLGDSMLEFTQFSVIKIPQQREFYYKDYQNAQWKLIRLSELSFAKAVTNPLVDGTLGVDDV